MASGNDMKTHGATYSGFISMIKWSVPILVITTAVVIILIS